MFHLTFHAEITRFHYHETNLYRSDRQKMVTPLILRYCSNPITSVYPLESEKLSRNVTLTFHVEINRVQYHETDLHQSDPRRRTSRLYRDTFEYNFLDFFAYIVPVVTFPVASWKPYSSITLTYHETERKQTYFSPSIPGY